MRRPTPFARLALLAPLLVAGVGGMRLRAEAPALSETSAFGDTFSEAASGPEGFVPASFFSSEEEPEYVAPEVVAPVAPPPEPIESGWGDGVPPVVSSPSLGQRYGSAPVRGDEWQLLPGDVLFKSFVAGVHAPRMAAEVVSDDDQGSLLDVTLGSRISIVRRGTPGPNPEGWELQVYGAALTRLAMDRQSDVEATDYKFGVPIVWRRGATAMRFGYDHVSSHIGDEFLIRNPGFQRINYVRDSAEFALIRNVTDSLALYGETNRAFHASGGAGTWHFQFGAEYQPPVAPGRRGAPVAAVNTLLREEFDYEGSFGTVVGWQWRGVTVDHLLRLGLTAYTGKSRQFSFYDKYEKLFGAGIWYDF